MSGMQEVDATAYDSFRCKVREPQGQANSTDFRGKEFVQAEYLSTNGHKLPACQYDV